MAKGKYIFIEKSAAENNRENALWKGKREWNGKFSHNNFISSFSVSPSFVWFISFLFCVLEELISKQKFKLKRRNWTHWYWSLNFNYVFNLKTESLSNKLLRHIFLFSLATWFYVFVFFTLSRINIVEWKLSSSWWVCELNFHELFTNFSFTKLRSKTFTGTLAWVTTGINKSRENVSHYAHVTPSDDALGTGGPLDGSGAKRKF